MYAPSFLNGAKEGAFNAMGAVAGLTMGLWPISFYGAGTVAVPLSGAIFGSIAGVFQAPPDAEIATADAALRKTVAEAKPKQSLHDNIVCTLRRCLSDKTILSLNNEHETEPYKTSENHADILVSVDITELEAAGPRGPSFSGNLVVTYEVQLIELPNRTLLYDANGTYINNDDTPGNWFEQTAVTDQALQATELTDMLDIFSLGASTRIVKHLFEACSTILKDYAPAQASPA